MKSRFFILLLGIVCAGFLTFGCGSSENSQSTPDSSSSESSSSSNFEATEEDENESLYTQQTFEFGEMFYSDDKLMIFFEEDESSGYIWECVVDGNSLEYDGSTFMAADELPVEISGDFESMRAFDFTGVEEGTCAIHFEELDDAEEYVRDSFSFDVEVGANGEIISVESW